MSAKYVLRDLPGVAELEERLARIAAHPNPQWAPDADGLLDEVDRVSRRQFGLALTDMEDWEPEPEENLDFDEAFARDFGWDVADGRGKRLQSFAYLAAPIIYASRGLKGHLPDPASEAPLSEKEVSAVEARLAAEAAKFRPKR